MIELGPKRVATHGFTDWPVWRTGQPMAHSCNCMGPQPGQTKCPCMLRGESEQGRRMVDEGLVIDGRKYRLIPDDAT